MEKFPRLFILAAIGYLLVGVVFGLGVGMGHIDPSAGRFIHAHLNLAGFMAMFIYGVAYHILPRFNATPIRRPGLVRVHFYLVNVGLLGMAASALFGGVWSMDASHTGFMVFGTVEAAGIFVFAYNIIPVLLLLEAPAVPKPVKAAPPAVTPEMKVAEIIEKWPQLTDLLVANGFKTLAIPAARATFAKSTTIEQACRVHRVDTDGLLATLNAALRGEKSPSSATASPAPEKKAASPVAKGSVIRRGDTPTADTLIGSLLEAYPESKGVFEKHYGEGCFSCPGQATETIGQTATMHGMKAETILGEILDSIKAVPHNADRN